MTKYADLADLPEDDRVDIIGRTAEGGQKVAFVVEDDLKADRYIRKLSARFNVEIEKRCAGPVKDTISVIVAKREVIQ